MKVSELKTLLADLPDDMECQLDVANFISDMRVVIGGCVYFIDVPEEEEEDE